MSNDGLHPFLDQNHGSIQLTTLLVLIASFVVAVVAALYLVYCETESDLPPRHGAHRHLPTHL